MHPIINLKQELYSFTKCCNCNIANFIYEVKIDRILILLCSDTNIWLSALDENHVEWNKSAIFVIATKQVKCQCG